MRRFRPQSFAGLMAFALLFPFAASLMGQHAPSLMPVPASVTYATGRLSLDSGFSAAISRFKNPRLEAGVYRAMVRLGGKIGENTGDPERPGKTGLIVEVAGPGQSVQTPEEDESYTLEINGKEAHLTAKTVVGALRGEHW